MQHLNDLKAKIFTEAVFKQVPIYFSCLGCEAQEIFGRPQDFIWLSIDMMVLGELFL